MISKEREEKIRRYIERIDLAVAEDNEEEMFDCLGQCESLYSNLIPEIDDCYEMVKQFNRTLRREILVVRELLDEFLLKQKDTGFFEQFTIYLKDFPDALAEYQKGIMLIRDNGDPRNALDSLRLSLEILLKSCLKNGKTLENNITSACKILKDGDISAYIRNILTQYANYNNDNVKHNNNIQNEEVMFIAELTSILIKLFSDAFKEYNSRLTKN